MAVLPSTGGGEMRRGAVLLALVGCGEPAPTWTEDIAPIVAARCAGCHQPGGIGPFDLTDYASVRALGDVVVGAVEARTMPPFGADVTLRAYLDDPSLTDEQVALFRDWLDAGMPEGPASAEPESLPPVGGDLQRIDVSLDMPEPYTPLQTPDDYRCFVLEWPADEEVYVTGFDVRTGNTLIDHHVAAYLFRPDDPLADEAFAALDAWDAADEGPGYACFGGPSGSSELQVPVQQLAQWVPGMGAVPFPEDTGIRVSPGSRVVLQLHYFTAGTSGESDQTGLDFMVERSVGRPAVFAPMLNATWPTGAMPIPAGEETTHRLQSDPRGFWKLFIGDVDLSEGFEVHSALMHMHTLGQHAELDLHRSDGTVEPLVHVPAYDFDWQFLYRFAESSVFREGDELSVSCTYDNTRDQDANWGEGSMDEMCVANLFVTPVAP